MHDGPGGSGLSRKSIMEEIDASLGRSAPTTSTSTRSIASTRDPVDETMEALHDVVKAGKARYIGASSMWAWQFAKMQHTADRHGWTRFISMQNQYSLLQREEEREMFGLLADQGVGSIPWSPLAKGALPGHGTRTPLRAPKPTPCRPAMSARPTNRSSGGERVAEARGALWRRLPSPGCCITLSSPLHRRPDEAASPRRCCRGPRRSPQRGRDPHAGRCVDPAPAVRLLNSERLRASVTSSSRFWPNASPGSASG